MIYTYCLCTLTCISWLHPVRICIPSRTVCIISFWCSHLDRNWSWLLASRCLCLIWTAFKMSLRHRFLDQISFWCDWQQTKPLYHNTMLTCFISIKINNPLLYSLCRLSTEYTFLYLCHDLHGLLCSFCTSLSFCVVTVITPLLSKFKWQFIIYQLNVDLKWLSPWASDIALL